MAFVMTGAHAMDGALAGPQVAIGLNAVLAAIDDGRAKVLCVRGQADDVRLPYGPFDPQTHRTFEIGLRDWVQRQTAISLGYVEQLYTFGDQGRESPAAALGDAGDWRRIISVGYLALSPSIAPVDADEAQWRDWYEFFPWEDWRNGEPDLVSDAILPALQDWALAAHDDAVRASRTGRIRLFFGAEGWEEERTLNRYELMYEAGLVAEAARDGGGDVAHTPPALRDCVMMSDHRRILATAIGRLRGKLKYRPIIFRLMPARFTLLDLQQAVEGIIGFSVHKQNFRRSVENSDFVARTDQTTQPSAGRPAALFEVNRSAHKDLAQAGLTIPRARVRPRHFA